MCCLCRFCIWILDMAQCVVSCCLGTFLLLAITLGLFIAIVVGVAYGYNYSVAEYLMIKNSNVSVNVNRDNQGVTNVSNFWKHYWKGPLEPPPKAEKKEAHSAERRASELVMTTESEEVVEKPNNEIDLKINSQVYRFKSETDNTQDTTSLTPITSKTFTTVWYRPTKKSMNRLSAKKPSNDKKDSYSKLIPSRTTMKTEADETNEVRDAEDEPQMTV